MKWMADFTSENRVMTGLDLISSNANLDFKSAIAPMFFGRQVPRTASDADERLQSSFSLLQRDHSRAALY